MARARLLKPGFFRNEDLAGLRPPESATTTPAASFAARICFEGLWVLADRSGRLEDRPQRLKADIFPYEDVDVDVLLETLDAKGFITRYISATGERFILVNKFLKHQSPHMREPESMIPAPDKHSAGPVPLPASHRAGPSVIDPVPVPESVPDPESESESVADPESLSGDGDGEQSSAAGAARNGNGTNAAAEKNFRAITKQVHGALAIVGKEDRETLEETVMSLCAQAHIAYNIAVVRKAIDSVRRRL